jgi:hypothetical protein
MEARVLRWFVVALAAIPVPLLFRAWYKGFSSNDFASTLRLLLVLVATASYIWLVLGMWFPKLLGSYYSNFRFVIIDGNWLVMVGCSIIVFLSKGSNKMPLGIACILTTVLWTLVAAVNVAI